MDVEKEFQDLMNEVLEKIEQRKLNGKYEPWEGDELAEKVRSILDHGDTSRYGNRCPQGHDDPDCGWSPSMGYHCF